MSRCPSSIRVGPYDYRIEWKDKINDEDDLGLCSNGTHLLKVKNSKNAVLCVDTLLHEIYHAIWWTYGVHDEDKQERIVSATSTAWTQVFRDNPTLMPWISAKLRARR